MSKIGPVALKLFALELLKIAVLTLVSAIETTFLNQSGPKLHRVFIGTSSQMSSIMSKIGPVTPKLFALELLEKVVYVIAQAPTFIDGFKYHFTQMLGLIISQARSPFRVLGSRSGSLWPFLEKLCQPSSTCIYWWILIKLHTNVGFDNILDKFIFQGPEVKVTVAIFRQTFSSL